MTVRFFLLSGAGAVQVISGSIFVWSPGTSMLEALPRWLVSSLRLRKPSRCLRSSSDSGGRSFMGREESLFGWNCHGASLASGEVGR